MSLSFLPNNAFPLPESPAFKLVALGLDEKTAANLSKVYISSALSLKRTYETEYDRACNAFISTSDNRGYNSKELRSRLLTVINARYTQALSKWMEEAIREASTSLLRRKKKVVPQPKVKHTTSNPNRESTVDSRPKKGNTNTTEQEKSGPKNPPHAFPRPYPPPVWPVPAPFVTHIHLSRRNSNCEPKPITDGDLDACIDAFSRLSLGPPPPQRSPKTTQKSRSRARVTSTPKPTSQLSPSRPRLVSPKLDTSVAVSHRTSPKNTPSPTTVTPTQNIDIPRSTRRKVCSIPYRRPTAHPSSSPESPSSSYFPCAIRRTPSLVSDHGSEASSPSTPPDIPSIPTPTFASARKDSSPDAISSLEQFLAPYPELGWQDFDLGIDLYG